MRRNASLRSSYARPYQVAFNLSNGQNEARKHGLRLLSLHRKQSLRNHRHSVPSLVLLGTRDGGGQQNENGDEKAHRAP